jgi:nanoRNase/pAp phosphatase (c-di-AMP/oligoRNAs hydrolase)
MRSVVYVEEDFVAGLLKEYFAGNGDTATLVRRGTNGLLAEKLSRSQVDLLLAQSEDPDRLTRILELVRQQGRRTPTLVLTSLTDEIPTEFKSFAHFVSIAELLESNLRWHIRLAMTMRRVEEVRAHFEDAESVAILLQDDPDPDAIGSGLALRQVLGRNKQTAPLISYGQVTRPENIAMVKLLEIEIEKATESHIKEFDRIAVVDLQPPHLQHPPDHVDLVIDHHPEQFNYRSHIKDIRPRYGATASILLEYLVCAGSNIGTRIATAMLYGIKTDTFMLTRGVNEWDVEAFSRLYPELPPAALDALGCALTNRRIIDKVAFVHLGHVERDDLIPQMADFSLSFEGIEWGFVTGVYESNYIISVRNVGYVRGAGRVLRGAFGDIGSSGGHGSMAKAIIPLSEFTRKWNIDTRNLDLVNNQVQIEFLRSLHSDK